MMTEDQHDIEDFFTLFHEPILGWVEDLEAMQSKNLFEPESSKGYRDTILLHYADRVEQLCALLAREYKDCFTVPVPSHVKSAARLRNLFVRLRGAVRELLDPKLVVKLEAKTVERLLWLITIDLDEVLVDTERRRAP